MKAWIHHQLIGHTVFDPDPRNATTVIREGIYNPNNLPDAITQSKLDEWGYVQLKCKNLEDKSEQELFVDAISRKFIVVEGVLFYSSSGTTPGKGFNISQAWRKDVWMPCVGFEIAPWDVGRIVKLSEQGPEEFTRFINKLISKWAEKITDDELRMLLAPKQRGKFDRSEVLYKLETELLRFGCIEAFSLSMQLLSDDTWREQEANGENFAALRKLRDDFLTNYKNEYVTIPPQIITEVQQAEFEVLNNEVPLVKKIDDTPRLELVKKNRLARQQESFEFNLKLKTLNPDITHIARLNNPDDVIPHSLSAKLGNLISCFVKKDTLKTQTDWDLNIDKIINGKLLPLEKPLDLEAKKEKYKSYFKEVLQIAHHCPQEILLNDLLPSIITQLNAIDIIDKEDIEVLADAILYIVHEKHLSQLLNLTKECMQKVPNKSAQQVLRKLNDILNNEHYLPKEKAIKFFSFLVDQNSKNLKVLEKNQSWNIKKFLLGISLVALILFTGLAPGLLILNKINVSLSSFFRSENKLFIDEISKIKPNFL